MRMFRQQLQNPEAGKVNVMILTTSNQLELYFCICHPIFLLHLTLTFGNNVASVDCNRHRVTERIGTFPAVAAGVTRFQHRASGITPVGGNA